MPMEPSTEPPRRCRRHRRCSDAFTESSQLRYAGALHDGNSSDVNGDLMDDCSEAGSAASHIHSNGLASDCEDVCSRTRTGSAAGPSADARSGNAAPIGYNESPPVRRSGYRHRHHSGYCAPGLLRNHTVCTARSIGRGHGEAAAAAAADIQRTIEGNTQTEPMSSMKALRIFDTVFSSGAQASAHSGGGGGGGEAASEHDPECKHCVSEALVTSHQAAARGIRHGSHGELRMNLGGGRNGVYVAPCEQHLECPLEKKGKYLVHTNKPKIMTDMSKVEFGICVNGWRRLVFKTVNDPELARRELSFYRKVATSRSDHLMHLLDDFMDNAKSHVMVFPRMTSARIHGHDLVDIAYIARQLFTALRDLHELGIAHLDITPTNLMSDPNDASHIEVIDFGLACDISEAVGGRLPSRGTCGFVAPEVLAGKAKDLRADVYSAGVVLGMMLQRYLPTVSLRLLGGPMVRSDTTDSIVAQLDELLEAYEYNPAQAVFTECNTTYVADNHSAPPPRARAEEVPRTWATPSSCPQVPDPNSLATGRAHRASWVAEAARRTPSRPEVFFSNKRSHVDDDDEAEALALAYAGGSSIYSNYGDMSDDEHESDSWNRASERSSVYSRPRVPGMASDAGAMTTGRAYLGGAQYLHEQAARSGRGYGDDSTDYFSRTEQYYTSSPQNTPTYAPREESPSLASQLAQVPENHSNMRYSSEAAAHRRSSASRRAVNRTQGSSAQRGSAVGRPGRVPVAVLHAADLLRWALQAEPQWRPTAAQALAHPFLETVEIRRWWSNPEPSSVTDSPRADSGISVLSPSGSPAAAKPGAAGVGRCVDCNGNVHTCVHTGTAVVSACNSKLATPVVSGGPAVKRREDAMFDGSGASEVPAWEGEMHQRVAHVRTGGERMDSSDVCSNRSYDARSSIYADNGLDDLSSYFY